MNSPSEKRAILIIDDNPQFAEDIRALTGDEFHLVTATSGEEGVRKLPESNVDVVLLDLKLGRGIDGLEVLRRLKRLDPDVPVIMITEHVSLETAHQAGQLGAAQYCDKAPNLKELRLLINQHLQNLPWRRAYCDEMRRRHTLFIGESPAVQRLFAEIEAIAPADCLVLITGESGSGKELVAREIHRRSHRANLPMLILNCSNLPPAIFESEFFGHEVGAFTGANKRQKGKFEAAHHGTLFLDEIADLPLESQPKILRVLETGDFRRLGGNEELHADVRIITATNQNLKDAAAAGRFRNDLLYRLQSVAIHVPSLHQRIEDIPLIVKYYLDEFSRALHKPAPDIPDDLMESFCRYDWPGNVRQLRGEVYNLVLFSRDGKLDRSRLRLRRDDDQATPTLFQPLFDLPYEQAKDQLLAQFQQKYFQSVLARCDGNYSRAAEMAGVNRTTIYRALNHAPSAPDEIQPD
jgi:DNA-binding NtrC family response regulator